MSTLYLIRHGRTPANEAHLYCGSTDLSLSEAGREALCSLHYDIHPQRILTSGMKRTEETLKILFGDVPYTRDPRFREIDFGIFEMKSYEQLKDDPAYLAWITGDNDANVPPRGESGNAMKQRVLSAIRDVLEEEADTLIVTHGGVIAMLLESFYPEAGRNRYQWQPEPGHGYAITEKGPIPIP